MVSSKEVPHRTGAADEKGAGTVDVSQEDINALYDAEVTSVDGDRLGMVRQVYLDDSTGVPTWITVQTGWFGRREHPVPLAGSEPTPRGLRVAVSGEEVRDAPTVEQDEHLSEEQLGVLRAYYGLTAAEVGDGDGVDAATTETDDPPGVWREDGTDVISDGTLTPEQAVTGGPLNIIRPGSQDLASPSAAVRRHERP